MIKILHIITSLDIGGAEMMLYKLLSIMNQGSYSTRVLSLKPAGPIGRKIQSLGIPVSDLGMKSVANMPKAFIRLMRIIFSWNPAIVQTWMYHADLLGLCATRIAGSGKVLWNIRCSNMDLEKYNPFTARTLNLCIKFSSFPDAVITNSFTAKDFHIGLGYRPKRFEVIPNGFDLNQFKPDVSARTKIRREWGFSEENLSIGMIARYDPMKDIDTFLTAARYIKEKLPSVRFVLCGKDMNEENLILQNRLNELELASNTHLLGPRNDIPHIMAGLDILVSSSSFGEGFPNVIGEAMACGLLCAVTDVGDSARIVGETGKTVMPKNPRVLADAVLELSELSPLERKKLGQKARKRIEDLYSLNKIAADYEKLYVGLLEKFHHK